MPVEEQRTAIAKELEQQLQQKREEGKQLQELPEDSEAELARAARCVPALSHTANVAESCHVLHPHRQLHVADAKRGQHAARLRLCSLASLARRSVEHIAGLWLREPHHAHE